MSLQSEYYNSLIHHGVKGQKWGVRRFENEDGSLTPAGKKRYEKQQRKENKKNVDRLHKVLNGTQYGAEAASMAGFSKIGKDDYEKAAQLVSSGRLLVDAKFKKNYGDNSVDVYIGKSATPTMKARMEDGENFVVDFVNENDRRAANDFIKYYQEHNQ